METNGIVTNGMRRSAEQARDLRKIRAPGELQALLGKALKKRPMATPVEIAEMIGISASNARMSLKRYKKNNKKTEAKMKRSAKTAKKSKKAPSISAGSAVARLLKGDEPQLTDAEKRFTALISFVGVDRAFALLVTETQRLSIASSHTPEWLAKVLP